MKIVELDLGASCGKMLIGDYNGEKLKTEEIYRFEYGQTLLNGSHYWNFLYIYDQYIKGLRKAAAAADGRIESVSADTFGNDFILLDKNDRLSFYNYSYNPTGNRFKGNMEKIFSMISPEELYERTGCQNSGFNTLMLLYAYINNNEKYRLDQSNTLLFIPDALNYFMTGNKFAEFTNSSITSMVNRHTGTWDKEIFERLDLPVRLLAPIIQSSNVVGEAMQSIKDDIGIKHLKVVTSPSHDTAAAVYAVPNTGDSFGFISSGTWSLVGIETDKYVVNNLSFKYNMANECNPEGRIKVLINVYGLKHIQHCKSYYNNKNMEFEFGPVTDMASKEPALRCFFNVDDEDFYYTVDTPEKVRKYCKKTGQFVPETIPQMVRCINDSLALKYKYTFDRLERATGIQVPSIHIVGGGAQNKLLCQLAANATGKPVYAGPYEAAGTGNLVTQLIAHGELKNYKEARELIGKSIDVMEYLPKDQELWKEKYDEFVQKCMNGII